MINKNEVKGCLIEKKGKYYATLYYYVEGQRVTETKATGISVSSHKKREAERIKNELIAEKQAALEQDEQAKHLHSFADCMEKWVAYKAKQIENTTASGYIDKSKTIIEYFRKKGSMIENLQPKDFLAYYEWALQYGRRNVYKADSSKALKRRTVRDQATLIKAFLNDAVLQGVIISNPADKVTVPRVKENNTEETAFMTKDVANNFLDFLKSNERFHMLYYICTFALYYGLRRSELLGLKWSAFNFDKQEFEINHTVVRVSNNVEHRDNVKTPSSHRYLPLFNSVKERLIQLMDWQKEHGFYSNDGYIFLRENGKEYEPDYLSKLFKKAVLACDSAPDNLTLHGLRHSCCSILFELGWDIERVQKWVGHSDISVTSNIYSHVSKRWINEKGQELDGLLH